MTSETVSCRRNHAKSKLGRYGSTSRLGKTPCVTAQEKSAITQSASTIASTRLELTSVVYVDPLIARCAMREANDVSDAGRKERVDPGACDARGVERQPADACVGIGGHEDIAPRTARAHGLRQMTAESECERDAMDRGKVVPERRDGIQDGFHALTLTIRC